MYIYEDLAVLIVKERMDEARRFATSWMRLLTAMASRCICELRLQQQGHVRTELVQQYPHSTTTHPRGRRLSAGKHVRS